MSQITAESIITADFDRLIEQIGHKIFKEDYKFTKEEVLGICISKYFKWDLYPLVDVFKAGLEDSNFHDIASKVDSFLDKELEDQI